MAAERKWRKSAKMKIIVGEEISAKKSWRNVETYQSERKIMAWPVKM
jgi:hypothetical protein